MKIARVYQTRSAPVTLRFKYRTYRGSHVNGEPRSEVAVYRVSPTTVWKGVGPHHDGEQWFLRGLDLDRNEVRDFAVRDVEPEGMELEVPT